jgi:hypothetical protein
MIRKTGLVAVAAVFVGSVNLASGVCALRDGAITSIKKLQSAISA